MSELDAELRERISRALYVHNNAGPDPLDFPADEYDCCADVAMAALGEFMAWLLIIPEDQLVGLRTVTFGSRRFRYGFAQPEDVR